MSMPTIYFPDVPEYQPFIRILCSRERVQCRKARDYVAVVSAKEIVIRREETGLFEAVWFGALVGGFDGNIVKFDADELRIS
jgi:hypothetical protein